MLEQPGMRNESVAAALDRISNGVGRLVHDHLELARVELREGAQTLRAVLLGGAIVFTGYVLLMQAASELLGHLIPGPLAAGLVALANLAAGAAVIRAASAGGGRAPRANRRNSNGAPGSS